MYSFKRKMAPYLFLLPNLIIFGIFVGYSTIYGAYISLTKWDILSKPQFIGFDNYVRIFNDARFWETFLRTGIYVFLSVILTYFTSMGLALILNKKLRFRGLFRACYYLPAMLSYIIIGVSWRWVLGENFGIFNYLLDYLGVGAVPWLTSSFWAPIVVVFVTVWARAGYYMIIFLAGLQGIPEMYYEAADIDGANKWHKFRYITFPLLKPTSMVVIVLNTIEVFKMYGLIHSLTSGGPAGSTTYLVQDIYISAFDRMQMGYASAQSVIFSIVIISLTFAYFKFTNRGGNMYG